MSVHSIAQPLAQLRPRLITVVERRHLHVMSVTDFCEAHGSDQTERLGIRLDPDSHRRQVTVHLQESNGWQTSVIAKPATLADEWRCAVCFPGQMVDV